MLLVKCLVLLKEKKCIKFSEWLSVHFKKFKDGELEPSGKIMFRSKPELVMNETDILLASNKSQERILDLIQYSGPSKHG